MAPPSTTAQSQTLTFGASGATTISFNPFDASLGFLQDVRVLVTDAAKGVVGVENLDGAPTVVGVILPSDVTISEASLGSSTVYATPSAAGTLQAYDGVTDDAGTSGALLTQLADTKSAEFDLTPADHNLGVFLGSAPVNIDVAAALNFGITAAGNVQTTSQSSLTASVSIIYDYSTTPAQSTPPTTGGGGGVIIRSETVDAITPGTTTAAQTVTEASQNTGWSDASLAVNQFDSSLGTLRSVNITLSTTVNGVVSLLSLSTTAAAYATSQIATVTLSLAGQQVSTAVTLTDSGLINAGSFISDPLSGSGSTTATLTDAADLAAFTGTGTIALPLNGTGASSLFGPNGLISQLGLHSGATVSVSYTYTPNVLPCFAAGSRISTPKGPVAVEALHVGQTVRTATGGNSRIVWIGSRTVDCVRHPDPAAIWPVRVRAHAFADHSPSRDLYLSPDHAVFADGVLVPVRHLLNGTTITQVPVDSVTYYHVELERHDILLADGLPTESFLDTGQRDSFNGGAVVRAVPDFSTRVWEAQGCAPIAIDGEAVATLRAHLAARSQGLARDAVRKAA